MTWGAVFPLTIGLGWSTGGWVEAALFGAGFLFGGLMFGPDLDLPSVQTRRWGPLKGIWKPYQWVFRHRSGWTHGLFLGPMVRVIYLGLWVGAAIAGLRALSEAWPGVFVLSAGPLPEVDLRLLSAGLVGIWAGSALHTISDVVVSWVKRTLRFRKSRR